jgi:molybdopterin-guanine dinucleotide biosynthesis protein A
MHKLTDLVYISYGDTIQMEAAECRIVRDIYKGCGPVGGMHAVLTRAFLDGAAAVATAACDMPYVTAELFGYLYEQLKDRTDISEDRQNPFDLYDGAVAVTGGKIHPLAAIYSVRAAGICKTQLEERNLRVRDALARMRILYVDLEGTAYERMILNINTEDDYTEYLISDAAFS